jgi:hypothetical protein
MRKRWLAGLTLALLWAAPLWAAVKLKVPERVTGEPGAFLVVKADTDGTACRWLALDAGLNVFPPDMLTDKRATVVTAHRAGRYRLLCYTAVGNEPSEPALCLIVVGEPGPEPGPGPGPGPGPEPPAPTDPLTKAVQAAYDADAGPEKKRQKDALAALYRQAVKTAEDQSLKTAADLLGILQKARQSLLPDAALLPLRQVISKELNAALGTKPDAALDADMRKKAAEAFGKIAAALEAMK